MHTTEKGNKNQIIDFLKLLLCLALGQYLCPDGKEGPRGPPGPQGVPGRDGRDGRDALTLFHGNRNHISKNQLILLSSHDSVLL